MSDLFDFKSRPRRFAVVGHPVMHSKSPQIHEAFARQCNVSLSYEAIALDPIAFEQGVRNLQAGGVAGINVTLPFKEAAFRLADEVSERAQFANAVNTVSFSGGDHIAGDNTDGIGLVRDLQENLSNVYQRKDSHHWGWRCSARDRAAPIANQARLPGHSQPHGIACARACGINGLPRSCPPLRTG